MLLYYTLSYNKKILLNTKNKIPVLIKIYFIYIHFFFHRYFQEVLVSPLITPEINEIQLHKDGSWSTQVIEKKPVTKIEKTTSIAVDDSIEIICDDVGKPFLFKCKI